MNFRQARSRCRRRKRETPQNEGKSRHRLIRFLKNEPLLREQFNDPISKNTAKSTGRFPASERIAGSRRRAHGDDCILFVKRPCGFEVLRSQGFAPPSVKKTVEIPVGFRRASRGNADKMRDSPHFFSLTILKLVQCSSAAPLHPQLVPDANDTLRLKDGSLILKAKSLRESTYYQPTGTRHAMRWRWSRPKSKHREMTLPPTNVARSVLT